MLTAALASASLALAPAPASPPSPVLAGDWPDPSVVKADDGYYGVVTSGGWAPAFRVIKSADLNSWSITGAVFRRRPGWVKSDLWAPEITRLGAGYAVYYSALPRKRKGSWYCLGVATASTPTGPWRDLGRPLRCSKYGSIDPYVARDANGKLTMIFKEDANEFKRPTTLFAQRLRADGKKLTGRPKALFRNTARWEGKVVEAPVVVRRDGWFYMLYSGSLCCTRKCAYAIGVARARVLTGPWRKFSGNPIMRSGNGWRCPGHATVVDDTKVLFHAYREGERRVAGRQVLLDTLSFGADGWPRIGTGRPAKPVAGTETGAFADDFRSLELDWEWPIERPPVIRTGSTGLRLGVNGRTALRYDGGVLTRRIPDDRFVSEVSIDKTSLRGNAQAGVASYRSGFEGIGLAIGRTRMTVWQRNKGKLRRLRRAKAPVGNTVLIRMTARGRTVRFDTSTDAVTWRRVGVWRGPLEDSSRLALTVGGAKGARARFPDARLVTGSAPPIR